MISHFKKRPFVCGGAFRLHAVVVAAGHGRFVGRNDFVGVAVFADLAIIDPDDAMTEAANLIKLVADEDDGAAGTGDVAHFAETFFLEIDVADGEDFIDEKNFRLEMGGDCKGEADVHAAADSVSREYR